MPASEIRLEVQTRHWHTHPFNPVLGPEVDKSLGVWGQPGQWKSQVGQGHVVSPVSYMSSCLIVLLGLIGVSHMCLFSLPKFLLCSFFIYNQIKILGREACSAVESMCAALAEGLSLVPSTRVRGLTERDSSSSLVTCTHVCIYTNMLTDTQLQIVKINL